MSESERKGKRWPKPHPWRKNREITKNAKITKKKKKLGLPDELKADLPLLKENDWKKKLIARMLLMGWTQVDIASFMKLSTERIRVLCRTPEFEMIIRGLEADLFSAIERKHQFLLHKAMRKLDQLLDSDDQYVVSQAIDKVFRIHGRYVDRIENLTPPPQNTLPLDATTLDKMIQVLELSKAPPLLCGEVIDVGEGDGCSQ